MVNKLSASVKGISFSHSKRVVPDVLLNPLTVINPLSSLILIRTVGSGTVDKNPCAIL